MTTTTTPQDDDDDKNKKKTTTTDDDDNDNDAVVNELVDQVETKLKVKEDDDEKEKLNELSEDDKKNINSKTLEQLQIIAKWIQSGTISKIIILSGAGVSCSAGIPDFRTPGTGLYDNLQKYNLPYPEAVFDLVFYKENPKPFCSLAKELWPGIKHSPTLTHSFIKLLSMKGLLLRNYTQNIDGLEFLAGIPHDELVECHGHFRTSSCISCHLQVNEEEDSKNNTTTSSVKDTILNGNTPRCSKCNNPVKPDIVFFGESLPNKFHKLLRPDLQNVNLLIVMGTSLQVAPVSMIPDMVSCKRILFNMESVMDIRDPTNDLFIEGDCDTNVIYLCKLLGWYNELIEQNNKTKIVLVGKDGGGKEKKES